MINGYLYEADSMDRVWPDDEPRGQFHFQRPWPEARDAERTALSGVSRRGGLED